MAAGYSWMHDGPPGLSRRQVLARLGGGFGALALADLIGACGVKGADASKAAFGRKFKGLKVTADEAPDYVERVLRGYVARREEGEAFAAYVSRAEEEWLL